jgi:steroid delta-isomerase
VPSAERLSEIACADARFRDPFNDLRGIEPLRRLLAHTRDSLPGVRFEVLDRAWSGSTVYLRWRMTARVRVLGDWLVDGMSEVRFAADGRVAEHLDYLDAATQLYGRLPLVGPLSRWLGRAARVG